MLRDGPRQRRARGAELRPESCATPQTTRRCWRSSPAHPDRAGPQAEQGRTRAARAASARWNWPTPTAACSPRSSSASAPNACRRALFRIAALATADISEAAFYRQRARRWSASCSTPRNFYIALLSDDGSALEFPYSVDEQRRELPTPRPLGRGLTEYVMRNGTRAAGSTDDILALAERGEIDLATVGSPAVCWLGVPLIRRRARSAWSRCRATRRLRYSAPTRNC